MALNLETRKKINVPQLYEFYMIFNGDVAKCALAMNIEEQVVRDLAVEERWEDRLARWNELRLDQSELQNYLNRAVNYIQAHRLRSVLDEFITALTSLKRDELFELGMEQTQTGRKFSARFLSDLVKAAEACQNMTYKSLGDKCVSGTVDPDGKGKGKSAAILVMKAMEAAEKKLGMSSTEIVRRQIAPPEG